MGDGWLGSRVGFAELPGIINKIKQGAEDTGRDPASLTFALGIEVELLHASDKPKASGLFAPDRALVGTAPQLIERIQSMREMGLQHLEMRLQPMRDRSNKSIQPTVDMLRHFAEEVMPYCRG